MKIKFFFFFLTAQILFAQNANEILKMVQTKFNSISSFSANFSQTVTDNQGKPISKDNGKFIYKRKNKFIADLRKSTIVSNGQSVWNFDKTNKKVVISTFFDDPTSFSIERFIFDYPALCRINYVKEESTEFEKVIRLIPKDELLDVSEIKIWINNSYLISKLEIVDLLDIRFSFRFTDILENPEISESRFNFYPPKGTKIIDLR
ncbi:MAG: outer membrane lipoprotein carrier protein LolA [Bacteroidota bacterium]